jgi:dolichol kinase
VFRKFNVIKQSTIEIVILSGFNPKFWTLQSGFFIAAFLAGIVAWTGRWASVPDFTSMGTLWPSPLQVLILSVIGALTSVAAEAWPSQWDDNIMIPFWTSLAIWASTQIMGIPTLF